MSHCPNWLHHPNLKIKKTLVHATEGVASTCCDVRYKMELLKFTDDVLKQIVPRAVDHWENWYRVALVCKRFKALVYHLRQEMLEAYIKWVSPESWARCLTCRGQLTDRCLTFIKSRSSGIVVSDSDDEFEGEWTTYCCYRCALGDNSTYLCDCGELVPRIDLSEPPTERRLCPQCDPNSFNEFMPARAHIPEKNMEEDIITWKLRRQEGFTPNCSVCDKKNRLLSVVIRGPSPGSKHTCWLVPLATVCSYTCYLRYKVIAEISKVSIIHMSDLLYV